MSLRSSTSFALIRMNCTDLIPEMGNVILREVEGLFFVYLRPIW
jgi:hypothetical protein